MAGPLKNPRHEKFCQLYSRDGNGGKAYRDAGFKVTTDLSASVCASKLLKTAKVAARVEDLKREVAERGVKLLISDRNYRVRCLQDRHDLLLTVLRERAAAEEMQAAPGGKTGLLCRKLKMIGSGKEAYEVEEFEVDNATLKEIRAHEQQAAQELGQWVEKSQSEIRVAPVESVLNRRLARLKGSNAGSGSVER